MYDEEGKQKKGRTRKTIHMSVCVMSHRKAMAVREEDHSATHSMMAVNTLGSR